MQGKPGERSLAHDFGADATAAAATPCRLTMQALGRGHGSPRWGGCRQSRRARPEGH